MLKDFRAESVRGRQSEENTRLVLKEMRDEGLILSSRKTAWGSTDDRCGIDFYISIRVKNKRIEIPLQVKSSKFGVEKHQQYGGLIHAVNGQATDLREQIEAVIESYRNDLGGDTIMAVVKEEVKQTVILPSQDHRVHIETNYNKFKWEESNRDIESSNIKKLTQSIKNSDLSDYFPILVNEKMEILDGQHRFTVWKSLGMPIKYKMVKNANREMIADINTAQSTWSVNAFIKHEAALGNSNFQLLQSDMKRHGISAMTLLNAILKINHYSYVVRNKILVYKKEDSNKIALFMSDVEIFRGFSFEKSTRFYQAFATLRTHEKYDHATMQKQVKRYGASHLNAQVTHQKYLEDLVYVFNYNRPKDKAINIRDFE